MNAEYFLKQISEALGVSMSDWKCKSLLSATECWVRWVAIEDADGMLGIVWRRDGKEHQSSLLDAKQRFSDLQIITALQEVLGEENVAVQRPTSDMTQVFVRLG
jgi:hypothetical protein